MTYVARLFQIILFFQFLEANPIHLEYSIIPQIDSQNLNGNKYEDFIAFNSDNYDFVICEIGGSAGDNEASYFLETIRRMIHNYTKNNIMICFVTYILYYKPTKELKTKPTQVAVKQLMSSGLQPDLIFARTDNILDVKTRQKIALYTNVKNENIIQAKNVSSIYELPLEYIREGFITGFSNHFNLNINNIPRFEKLVELKNKISNIKKTIKSIYYMS